MLPGPVPDDAPVTRAQGTPGMLTLQAQLASGGVTVSVKVPPALGALMGVGEICGMQLRVMPIAALRFNRGLVMLLRLSVTWPGCGRQEGEDRCSSEAARVSLISLM